MSPSSMPTTRTFDVCLCVDGEHHELEVIDTYATEGEASADIAEDRPASWAHVVERTARVVMPR